MRGIARSGNQAVDAERKRLSRVLAPSVAEERDIAKVDKQRETRDNDPNEDGKFCGQKLDRQNSP